jgi:hypothetical protein
VTPKRLDTFGKVLCKFCREQDVSLQQLTHALDTHSAISSLTNHRKLEPLSAANIAVSDFANVQSDTESELRLTGRMGAEIGIE